MEFFNSRFLPYKYSCLLLLQRYDLFPVVTRTVRRIDAAWLSYDTRAESYVLINVIEQNLFMLHYYYVMIKPNIPRIKRIFNDH